MAIAYVRQIAASSTAGSTAAQPVTVGAPGVSVGQLVVVAITKALAMNPTIADSKANTWTTHGQANEPVDTAEVAVFSSVITNALLAADTITPNFGGTFSQKTWQLHVFSGTSLTKLNGSTAASTFPHSTQSAGSTTVVAGDALFAAFVQNSSPAVTWTPGTGFTALASIDPGEYVGFAQYHLTPSAGAQTVLADSNVDSANAGVAILLREGGAPPPGKRLHMIV